MCDRAGKALTGLLAFGLWVRSQVTACALRRCQVESASAVEAIPAIAAVDGVDAIFVGPSDLAASIGHLGSPSHPDVCAAMDRAFALCANAGVPCGALSGDEVACGRLLAQGAAFVAVGTDLSILGSGLRRVLRRVREEEKRVG